VADPASYYRTNVVKGLALLEAMQVAGVRDIVFSSTCAVYGIPVRVPIDEDHPKDPSTLTGDEARLRARAGRPVPRGPVAGRGLRYFNAAGCHPDGSLGEDHRPEEHLIPRAIDAALGRADRLHIHGEDYDTPDGTCIRDYIHVQDLARAHVLALNLVSGGSSADRPAFQAFNLGTGVGRSVREVLQTVERIVGNPVPPASGRAGRATRRASSPPPSAAGASSASRRSTPRSTGSWRAPCAGAGTTAGIRNRVVSRGRATPLVDPLLTVVMPVYNEAATVREIVERVLAVPVRIELIAVDDASSDGSHALLEELARKRGFKLFTRKEHGQGRPCAAASRRRAARSSWSRTPTWSTARRSIPSCSTSS